MIDLPEIPDDDSDFTPDLARKIIAKYQEFIRSQSLTPEVRRLVIAARRVAFEEPGPEEFRELDNASEAFAALVPWEDEPEETT